MYKYKNNLKKWLPFVGKVLLLSIISGIAYSLLLSYGSNLPKMPAKALASIHIAQESETLEPITVPLPLPEIKEKPSNQNPGEEQEDTTGDQDSETEGSLEIDNNSKPPENNPETVAGHEQTKSEQTVQGENQETNQVTAEQTVTPSPYLEPTTSTGQVAAAQTTTATPVINETNRSEAETVVKNENAEEASWPLIALPAGLILFVLVLYPIKKFL